VPRPLELGRRPKIWVPTTQKFHLHRNFKPPLTGFAFRRPQNPAGDTPRGRMNILVFVVAGWDDDPREIA